MEGHNFVHKRSRYLGGLCGEVENVEVGPAAVIQSGISEIHISKSEYLASREVTARVSHFIYSTVSADENPIGRTQNNHSSRETVDDDQKYPQCDKPKYLRRNDTETLPICLQILGLLILTGMTLM